MESLAVFVLAFYFTLIGLSRQEHIPSRSNDFFRKEREQHNHLFQRQQSKQEQKLREEIKKPLTIAGSHISEELENISWPAINVNTRNKSFRKQELIYPKTSGFDTVRHNCFEKCRWDYG